MRKNIVEEIYDNKHNLVAEVADYIGVEAFAKEIAGTYQVALNWYLEEGGDIEYYFTQYVKEIIDIEERAYEYALQVNREMKKYLHMKNHRIDGNFANIEQDYPYYKTGEWYAHLTDNPEQYDKWLPQMIERLDNAEDSPIADDDREYLMEWFFETFGTYNIKYKFEEELNELYYEFAKENEKV